MYQLTVPDITSLLAEALSLILSEVCLFGPQLG